ncbi:hypothetical protein BSPWISOXPB_712 [uncultured Gammaproteobacteria bacterium]|nr:hypothetical protein BSPWISOXPB_712 [uncultured Gammaproteobacteria bacterium]
MMVISATTDDPAIAKVTAIAGMLLMGDALGGAGLSAAESGAVIGFTQGTLNSANLGEGVKQGVISGVTAAAISEVAHGGENNASEFTTTEQLALQGLVGGISTELRGGKFQDGFVSAIISKGVDLGLEGQQLDFYTQGAITMIAGGLASKAGGGSFEDGAVQAGMVFLYNSRGAIKLNGKIPSWLNKLFDYEGQGGSVGIAFSAPRMLGDDEWDLGVFVEGHGGGDDYGIGKLTVGGEYGSGSVRDMNGTSTELSMNYGAGGGSLSFDNQNNLDSIGIHFGPGYNIGGSGLLLSHTQ